MTRKTKAARLTRRSFGAGLGAAGFIAGTAPFNIVRAQGAALKVGVLLPRSGYAGRHRPGLLARRRNRQPASSRSIGLPELADHERRHRDQRRRRALARREADRRRRAASDRRLRFRRRAPPSRRSPSRRASPSSSTSPPPRRSPSRATSSCSATSRPRRMILRRRLRQPEGNLRGRRRGAEDGGVHARQRHLRHRDEERHRRGDAEVRHALQDRRDDLLRSGGARSVGRDRPRPRRPAPTRCWW